MYHIERSGVSPHPPNQRRGDGECARANCSEEMQVCLTGAGDKRGEVCWRATWRNNRHVDSGEPGDNGVSG